jgi:hypothetical protein
MKKLVSENMKVSKLYIINHGDDEDIVKLACRLVSWGYKLTKVVHGNEVVKKRCILDALFDAYVDELEFNVNTDLNEIISDLYYISGVENISIDDMLFVVKVKDGYVYIPPKDVIRIEFDEEIYDDEEEKKGRV